MDNDQNKSHYRASEPLLKRRCHSCKCEAQIECLVGCRNPSCKLLYCRKCLTSRYKFSKAKASTLPTLNWRCPVCTRRCFCTECLTLGVSMPVQKVLGLHKNSRTARYKRKRIRKSVDCVLHKEQNPQPSSPQGADSLHKEFHNRVFPIGSLPSEHSRKAHANTIPVREKSPPNDNNLPSPISMFCPSPCSSL